MLIDEQKLKIELAGQFVTHGRVVTTGDGGVVRVALTVSEAVDLASEIVWLASRPRRRSRAAP